MAAGDGEVKWMGVWAGVAALTVWGLWGWAGTEGASAVRPSRVSQWAKAGVALCVGVGAATFTAWAYVLASRRPELPSRAEMAAAVAGLFGRAKAVWGGLERGVEILKKESGHKGMGRGGTLLYLHGSRFWATMTMVVVLSGLSYAVQWVLERDVMGVFGLALPVLLLIFYVEWVHQCGLGNFRPRHMAHFDEQNILLTHPPDRREIPASAFDPPTPKWSDSDPGTSDDDAVTFGDKDRKWTTIVPKDEEQMESPERRRQREEFERKRDAHYGMGHLFKPLNLDDVDDEDDDSKNKDGDRKAAGASPTSDKDKKGKHATFVEPEESGSRERATLSHEEFAAKRRAMEAALGQSLTKAKAKDRAEAEKRQALAEGAPDDEEEEEKEKTGAEEKDAIIASHEVLSQHFLGSVGEESLLPDDGSPLVLIRYLRHQIKMANATAAVLQDLLQSK